MLRTACPKCKTVLSLPEHLAGKRIKCKNCETVFAVPSAGRRAAPAGAAKAASAGAAKAAPAKTVAPAASPDNPDDPNAVTPYAIEPMQAVPETAKDNRIDQMVRTAERTKRRNRQWNKVGPPATYLKWTTLIILFLATALFLWWTTACVLMAHKWEQWERAGKEPNKADHRWLFPLDEFGFQRDDAVPYVWGIGCAWYFPLAILGGITLAGAESMRRLENYRWAMAGACTGALIFLPLGMMCIVRLMDKEVQREFEISRMRAEGVDWEAIEDEELAAAEEEEEDEEEEEEEETPQRRRRR